MIEIVQAIIFAVCLMISACFSGSETALTSMSKLRVKRLFSEDDPTYKRLESWLQEPNRYLATILVGNNFVNVLASVVAADLCQRLVSRLPGVDQGLALGSAIAVGVTTMLLLIFGEIVPKTFCKEHAVAISQRVIGPLDLMWTIMKPVIIIFVVISNAFIRLMGGSKIKEVPLLTEDDVRALIEMGEKEGVLEQEEREMIHSIIDFGDTQVKEIMTPRVDMQAFPVDLDLESARKEAVAFGHSRIPVYEDELDHIVGVLYVKDLLKIMNGDGPQSLRELIRPPLFAPKTKKVSELLDAFKIEKIHMAIVVDEYGLTAGLVTIEDVLEEIVGDIQDEYDQELPEYEIRKDGTIIADAKIDLDILADVLKVEFPEEDVETLGGFISTLMGRVPEVGEETEFQFLRFIVMDSDERRIKRVQIVRIDDEAPSETPISGADS